MSVILTSVNLSGTINSIFFCVLLSCDLLDIQALPLVLRWLRALPFGTVTFLKYSIAWGLAVSSAVDPLHEEPHGHSYDKKNSMRSPWAVSRTTNKKQAVEVWRRSALREEHEFLGKNVDYLLTSC